MSQSHRGAHLEDRLRFEPGQWGVLRRAVSDLSWLLSRDYAIDSSLKLVGDRYQLHLRQRLGVRRAACADVARDRRRAHRRTVPEVEGLPIRVDGFNLLITIEAALSGGLLIRGRDGCIRDLASVHGTWRAVEETDAAIQLIGGFLEERHRGPVTWYLDRPISNSGRLRQFLEDAARARGWPWTIEVVNNPDAVLREGEDPVVSSDAIILDAVPWVALVDEMLVRYVPGAWLIDLGREEAAS